MHWMPTGGPFMYCPECGIEYRDGVTVCIDCAVPLTPDPPPAPPEPTAEWVDLVTVLETSDPTLVMVARSLLEAEGIPCYARSDTLQELLGLGRAPSGVNLLIGPVQLQVPTERGGEALELLAAPARESFEPTADDSTPDE